MEISALGNFGLLVDFPLLPSFLVLSSLDHHFPAVARTGMAGPPPSLALPSLASWSCPSAHLLPYHFLSLSTILSSVL